MTAAGYAIHPDVFSAREIGSIAAAIENVPLRRTRAGARHVLGVSPVEQVARDPRLFDIAACWVGRDATPFKATLFDKNPGANWLVAWHQDTSLPLEERREASGWGPWSEKEGVSYAHAPARALENVVALRVHLDDSFADNGPLRVLPGTHLLGVLTDAQVGEHARNVAPVECNVAAGGVVVMRPLIIHASSKAASERSRRVLHIEYASSLELESGLRLRVA